MLQIKHKEMHFFPEELQHVCTM